MEQSGPILDNEGMVAYFGANFVRKKGILLTQTS